MPTRKSKTDKRLLGTWRSDRRRTLKDWIWPRDWPARKRKKLAGIFGHLTLRYTQTRSYSDYRGHKEIRRYEVVAADSDSVAIRRWDSLYAEWRIRHIHFEGDRYWISLGRQREWFRRVKGHAG
jgi:hypothetical protein